MAQGSKRHRHEEAIDARLAAAARAIDARRSIFIPIENPIVAVLARERHGDRDRTMIPVHAVVVGVAVDLVGRQMMRVCGAAARSLHPIGDRGAVCPLVVGACRTSGQRSEDRNQTLHTAFRAMPCRTRRPLLADNRLAAIHTLRIRPSPASQAKAPRRVDDENRREGASAARNPVLASTALSYGKAIRRGIAAANG
jgi:hypothetical protein